MEMQSGRERTRLAGLIGDCLGETSKSPFLRPPKAEDAPCHRLLCEEEFAPNHGANVPCSLHLPSSRDARTSHDIPAHSQLLLGPLASRVRSSPPLPHSELWGEGLTSEVLSIGCRVLQLLMAGRQWGG